MTYRDDAAAKRTVLEILSDPAISSIDFWVATRHVDPLLYRSVAHAIRRDEITIIHDPKLREGGRTGAYAGKQNLLGIASDTIEGNDHQRLMAENMIVHECTHAGFDYRRHKLMTHLEGEAAAYIAGFIFLLAKCERTLAKAEGYRVGHRDPATNKILTSALEIAKNVYYERKVSTRRYNHLLLELEAGLRDSSLYGDIINKVVVNDGVGSITAP